ncbi:MAG: hypothetical protein RLZZ480_369 [Candidatus Parcubacteria bacterium]|jgi:uncharacterized protein (DUF305 family)
MQTTKKVVAAAILIAVVGAAWYALTHRKAPEQTMTYEESAPENLVDAHAGNMTISGIAERDFLRHMIAHHEEGVAASKILIANPDTLPQVKTFAEGLAAVQEKELSDMKTWYEAWYSEPYSPSGAYKPLIRDLSTLSGDELNRAFLEDMIKHHTDALTHAQAVSGNANHDEVKAMAKTIAATKPNEIISMRIFLKQLPAAD